SRKPRRTLRASEATPTQSPTRARKNRPSPSRRLCPPQRALPAKSPRHCLPTKRTHRRPIPAAAAKWSGSIDSAKNENRRQTTEDRGRKKSDSICRPSSVVCPPPPQRDRFLRPDRRARRILLGRADRTLAA